MRQKTVVVFSSHVARGSVGLRACSLALEALGNCVASIPTTILSHHPGHGVPPRVTPSDQQFRELMEGLCRPQWMDEVDAVICGYFASPSQVQTARDFYRHVAQHKGEDAVRLIVDPVIGDNGRLYVADSVAEAIRDFLLPLANFITPNRFELQWLSGHDDFRNNNEIIAALKAMAERHPASSKGKPASALVTSAFPFMAGRTGSLLLSGGKAHLAEHPEFPDAPNGLGDLTSAVFTHHLLAGRAPTLALEKTTASVAEILQKTLKEGKDELAIEANLSSLVQPFTRPQMRQILTG